ncbi:hypothetical protein [Bradyrhizobium sp. CIR3A]|uniref:hypothetical protein n=1 Tax=Bradyrhizobium sp. CIR3A TaxID=2663838 RepID=UPI00160568FD|nr:hypothetical protein [Bradyrhizobium sp. CIR3A]MBB4263068.1 hypothetical protein [Bradyrhizobium sp. CIR3A]
MSLIAMAEHLDMLRAIAGRTMIPIVADFRSDLRMAAIGLTELEQDEADIHVTSSATGLGARPKAGSSSDELTG